MIGRTLSHYRIDRRLGEGGMGVLYAAEDVRLGRRVAVKFLRDEAGRDPAALERFRREARAASALSNPHICTVHDVGLEDGRPFIVMELLEGTTLADRLREGPLPLRELLDLAVQLADALAAAHAKGIVHRDIKPGNVFLTDSGLLKVLDFGVAKFQGEPSGQTTSVKGLQAALLEDGGRAPTSAGLVIGTVRYMSPEQARGREIDARSDVFALGAVLYEMATGRAPFAGGSANEVIDAVVNHTPLPPSRLRSDLPRELDAVVLRALEKHREDRYQSAAEALASLRALQAGGWDPEAQHAAPTRDGGGGTGHVRSLAVIPLQALSTDADQELLADGMTDALIAHLSRIRTVRVISRTSVLRYKGRTKTVPQIARELNVDAIVEGSLLLSGGRVRVTARLIDAAEDHSVWCTTYERELRDVLALQGELAQEVAREIRAALTPDEERRLFRTRPVDPEAHFAFLRGQYHASKGSPADLRRALQEYRAAVERDPTFAPAWAGIGWAYTWLAGAVYGALPPRDAMPLAKAAAQRALDNEPLTAAHAILGYVAERYEYDFGRACEEFERALELEATRRQHYVSADWIALVHMGLGRRSAAREWLETAFEERAPGLALLGVTPPADGLRSHPGFRKLLQRVGLPAADLRPGATRASPGPAAGARA